MVYQRQHILRTGPDASRRIQRQPETGARFAAGMPLPHAQLLRMQSVIGNARVARSLAQRDAAGGAAPPAPAKSGTGEKKEDEPRDPIRAAIYKAVADQLGEDKLKELAKSLAGKAADLLIAKAKDATSDADFVAKAQVDLIGKLLSEDLKKTAEGLLKTPEGQKLRERILATVRQEPLVVVAAAIAAAAVAIALNVEIPEIDKKFELFKGFEVAGKLDVGKARDLTLKHVGLGLKYTHDSLALGVSGETGEKDPKTGEKKVGFKADATVNPKGTVQISLGAALDLKSAAGTDAKIDPASIKGLASIRLGGSDTYMATTVSVDASGNATLDVGGQVKTGGWTFKPTVSAGKEGIKGGAELAANDVLGLKGLEAKGSIKFGPAGLTSASATATYMPKNIGKDGLVVFNFTLEGVSKPGIGGEGPVVGVNAVFGAVVTFP